MNTTIDGKSELPVYWGGGEVSEGFETGVLLAVGNTFVLSESFHVSAEFRYEYEHELEDSYVFNNLGLGLQFSFR